MRDEIRKIIRDAFLEGRDDEAIRMLKSDEYRESLGPRSIIGVNSSGVIYAGRSAMAVARPQRNPFKPYRFAVDSGISDSFVISDIRIGNNSVFLTAADISADFFKVKLNQDFEIILKDEAILVRMNNAAEESFGVAIDCPTCQISQDLVAMVVNISDTSQTFRGAFLGCEVLKYP